jgi:hypothetical protein
VRIPWKLFILSCVRIQLPLLITVLPRFFRGESQKWIGFYFCDDYLLEMESRRRGIKAMFSAFVTFFLFYFYFLPSLCHTYLLLRRSSVKLLLSTGSKGAAKDVSPYSGGAHMRENEVW